MKKQYEPYELNVNTLGFYVDRLLYTMIKRQNKILKERGSDLQHAEFIVLKVINELNGASQSQLAKVMGRERSGIGRILNSLEKKGYIDRKALNGSTNFVTLSEKGKEMRPFLLEVSDQLTNMAFKGISEKSRNAILNHLYRLYKNVL